MRIFSTKLLISLILVMVASLTLSTASSAFTRLDQTVDPSWIASLGHPDAVDLNGEPEAGGGSAPPPTSPQGRYGAAPQRGDAPVNAARTYQLWLTWMSRIWAARQWGVTF